MRKWGAALDKALRVIALCLAAGTVLSAQSHIAEQRSDRFPLQEWLDEKERSQIPWQITFSPPQLWWDQRVEVSVEVYVSGNDLANRGSEHEFVLVMRLLDAHTKIDLGRATNRARTTEGLPHRGQVRMGRERTLFMELRAYVLPGDYKADILLFDQLTGDRNVTHRQFRVTPIKRDPLPEAFRNLPRVEFWGGVSSLDTLYAPHITSRLWLPIKSRRSLKIDVVAESENPRMMLGLLKVFSQLEVANGTLRITMVDLHRGRVLFDQEDVHQLDWPHLRQAFQSFEQAPKEKFEGDFNSRIPKHTAEFLRNLLAERMTTSVQQRAEIEQRKGREQEGNPCTEGGARIVILLFQVMYFSRGADLSPISLESKCKPAVFHLFLSEFPMQFETHEIGEEPGTIGCCFPVRKYVPDELDRMLEKVRPHLLMADTIEKMRKALAVILTESSRL